MDHFAGLDVSVKETSVCIVDDAGKIVRGSEGSERTRRKPGSSVPASKAPLQADWTGSWTAVAMAHSRFSSNLFDAVGAQGHSKWQSIMVSRTWESRAGTS